MSRFLKLSIVVALTMLTLACAPSVEQGGAGSQPSAQEPKYGGVLHYPASGIAPSVHPYTNAASGTDIVVKPVYEPLLKTVYLGEATDADPEYAIRPWLADSWSITNPTTYVFKIHQGIKWQDSRDFTAEDVVFTWDFLLKNKGQFSTASNLSQVQSFRTIDTYTVELVAKAPDANFLQTVIVPVIIPKHLVEAGADLTKVSMGTGPFKVKDFSTARGVVHVKNENYWNKGLPYLDGIIGYYNMDRSAQIAAMAVGQLDIFHPSSDPEFQAVQSGVPNLQRANYSQANNWSFFPNLTRPPFTDLKVRQAINLVIDRKALNDTLNGGKGGMNTPVVPGWLTPFALPRDELLKRSGFNPATKQQDIAEAKKLLSEAGYPNGFKGTLIYQTQFVSTPPLAEIVSTQLKAVGIDLTLRPAENNLYNEVVTLKGDFDFKLEGGGGANFGIFFRNNFHSKGVSNKQGIADSVLDGLIERQAVTLDEKDRVKILYEIQRRILDNAYMMPTIDNLSYATWQPWVYNYAYSRSVNPRPSYQPFRLWLDTSMLSEARLKEDAATIK